MSHRWEIRKNKKGDYVAYFIYNNETIWWTEGYSSKASAKNAIASIIKNGPNCATVDQSEPMKETTSPPESQAQKITVTVPNSLGIIKSEIRKLTYEQMMEFAQGLMDKTPYDPTTVEYAEGIIEWAKS